MTDNYRFQSDRRGWPPPLTKRQRWVLEELLPADQLHLLDTMTRDEASAWIT
jgi:hypothetical protein